MFPEKMTNFIEEHHVLTLAVTDGDDLWCSHAFYTFVEAEQLFVITSEDKTRHTTLIERGSNIVAGAIALETEKIGLIRGLQFKAEAIKCDRSLFNKYRFMYLKRFPYAILTSSDIWILRIIEAKFTDNRLVFGKKLIWKR
ncbi:MAG TPA: hypothetical protein P5293_07970 [Bacteroidales bacterium]|nr:hypothetical protein [Bacteroidales bacterium]